MALIKLLRLSHSPSLHHCRRTFSSALNHSGVFFRSNRLIGPSVRHLSTSPLVSDDMQRSIREDLIHSSVESLRMDVISLGAEICLLREAVETIGKCNNQRIVREKDDGNGDVGESVLNEDEKIIKKSDFSEAMVTHFNTISQDNNKKVAEKMRHFSEEIQKSDTEKMSDFSEAMATHFNSKIVISQDSKTAERISDFSENIQEIDTEGDDDKATETMSDLSESIATDNAEIMKSGTEGDNEIVSDGKELQDPILLKELEYEISRALDFSRVSRQGIKFSDDFPFNLKDDVPGVASITLKRRYKKLEKIIVTVKKPSVFTPITTKNYQYYKNSTFIMQLTVEIFPLNATGGRDLAFKCSAFGTGFLIENVYGDNSDQKGLVFSELSEELQKSFKKYLEMRGIKPSTTNIMFGYMLNKVNREKLRILYKIKELLEA